jgi:type II secretory pathway component GspD/PulD (secretin)
MRNSLWGGLIVVAILTTVFFLTGSVYGQAYSALPTAVSPAASPVETTTVVREVVSEEEAKMGGTPAMPPGAVIIGPDGKPINMPGGKPGEGKPGEGKPGEGKPGDKKPDEPGKPIQHPNKPKTPPKPEELKVRPGTDGKVSFNFNGQAWSDVLEWLAQISNMSLDWQEMPGDFLNLSTQRSYTLPEVRDMINERLIARGYTLLTRGESLYVAKLKGIDLGIVPRVTTEDLKKLQPNEFVRVSFALETMSADTAVQELTPIKSPNGQLIALKLTNQLEAIDTVSNLREIDAMLARAQSPEGRRQSPKEFLLRYAKAEEVKEQLEAILKDKPGGAQPPGQGQMTPEQMQQMQQMQQQQQQQMEMMQRQGGGNPGGQPPQKGAKAASSPPAGVVIVANARRNSLLISAPPDKMITIEQVIDLLDVPIDSQKSLAANINRTKMYRLTGVEPETLVKTLQDIGNLDPTTSLQVDRKNKAIIVSGSLADHTVIAELVKKLSGTERTVHVRRLRRQAADKMAGTIEFIINGEKKDKKSGGSYYDRWYGGWGGGSDRSQTQEGTFRVDADVEHNQLILLANDIEMQEVDNLLQKLGENTPNGSSGVVRRVIDAGDAKEAQALLERIERNWNALSPNPLEVKPLPSEEKSPLDTPPASQPSVKPLEEAKTASAEPSPVVKYARLGGDGKEAFLAKASDPPPKSPAVKVEILPDGRIAVASEDPQALDLFEDMADQLSEARKDYKIFRLKYCLAYGVALKLEQYFKSDLDKEDKMPSWMRWEMSRYGNSDDNDSRLSKKKQMKFITDTETNSILVQGASEKQLQTIDDLIKLYDKPLPSDAQSKRKQENITLEYSKADVVANTVKDVYRDLLSTNDKAFGGKNEQSRGFSIFFDSDDEMKKEQKTPKFQGSLSIGVDAVSNTIVLSAPTYLFDEVKQMIVDLDQAAAPASQMKVIKLGPGMSGPEVRRQLLQALGQDVSKKELSEKKTPPPNNENEARNNRNRNRNNHGGDSHRD